MFMFWIIARVFAGLPAAFPPCLRSVSASTELKSIEAFPQLSIMHVMEAQGVSLEREHEKGGCRREFRGYWKVRDNWK